MKQEGTCIVCSIQVVVFPEKNLSTVSNISLNGCPHFMAFQTGKGGYSVNLSSLGKKSVLWE